MEFQQFFLDLGLPPALVVIIIAALPVVELRGAVPVAINVLDIPWYNAFLLAVIGNMLPVPFILRLLNWAVCTLGKFSMFRRFFDWLFNRTRSRSGFIERYKKFGLTLFVAIPLPMTGAWTGSIAAVLMGIPFGDAMRHIFLGVLIAGIIVTALSVMGWWGALTAGAALVAMFIIGTLRRHNRRS
ncbi:small multi-drug export protein [Dehalogenimonas sp. THU2]|uniref:COG2426 family protein n=1 Tax=Dehalogenimonas sp. THU2 TaxID=3151121 RepID=UPI00321894C1